MLHFGKRCEQNVMAFLLRDPSNMNDKVTLENLYNRLELNYYNRTLGNLQLNVGHNNYNYGYDKVVVLNDNTIPNRLKGNIFSVGGNYNKQFKNL